MASGAVPPIEVKALWDGTQLKAGTQESERYIDSLADAVDDSSDAMRRSLDSIDDSVSSTFSGSSSTFGRAVSDVENDGQRLGGIGSEIGSEFSENIGEGIRSGDIAGSVTETFTSLAGSLGVVGIGIAVGAGFINGAIKGAQATRQAFVDAVNEAFNSIEVKANQSSAAIAKAYTRTLTFKKTLEDIGGGDALKGFEKLQGIAEDLGVSVDDVVLLLQGRMTEGAKRVRDAMIEVNDTLDDSGQAIRESNGVLSDVQQSAATLNTYYQRNLDVKRKTVELLQTESRYAADIAIANDRSAGSAERYANALSRAADSFSRMYGRELPYGVYPE